MDAITLARELEARYRRYLRTTFFFRDLDLRKSFESALASGALRRGPYLEATPVFRRGMTPGELLSELSSQAVDAGLIEVVEKATPRLYRHQEDALRASVAERNVVVATGTGSGKTEAFLYPILLHLYQESVARTLGPGVRALVLYPMNALANDQRERLGKICLGLQHAKSKLRFSFGQYVGETPENENDSRRHAREHLDGRLPGELVLRSEMRRTPPNILLTNYSMLEYLLLRPLDSPLFDEGRAQNWKFIVLDEAHQYRGSRGIEMAMLLRRLKRRLTEGGRLEPVRCVATSASLSGGQNDKAAIAQFASDLFGEEFRDSEVILGEQEPVPNAGSASPSVSLYPTLRDVLVGNKPVPSADLAKASLPVSGGEETFEAAVRLLQSDRRAIALRRRITGNPRSVEEEATETFPELPEDQRVEALSTLVDCLVAARDRVSGAPLLSVRYHLFLKSLEGAFVSYWPEKKVFLDRRASDDAVAFETALCRECGQHYFVGPKDFRGGKLGEAVRDPSNPRFGATFFRPLEERLDSHGNDDVDEVESLPLWQLCTRCGEVSRDELHCGHDVSIPVARDNAPADEDRADQLARCGACGYGAGGRDPVREVVHGTDGPNAVIATTLFQRLPPERRKVLAFSDGRQEAAFFAWYLEHSYGELLARNLLLSAVKKLNAITVEGISIGEAATSLHARFREMGVFPPATGEIELRRQAWLAVYREYLTEEPRISLEGVGLMRWSIKLPPWVRVPKVLLEPPWSLSEQEGMNLLALLLDSIRGDRAVELRGESNVPLNWADLLLHAQQFRVRVDLPRGSRNVRSWDGKTGKRTRLLAKLLMRLETRCSEQEAVTRAVGTLRQIWEELRLCEAEAPHANDRLLLTIEDARRLNPEWCRMALISGPAQIFECDTCSRLQSLTVRGVCSRHQCPGSLGDAFPETHEAGHYRMLYEENLPGKLRVEEHTAQLEKEKAREFQRDFRRNNIHVLSCSTTFELGVDLGDLDTIFLRNVPPEAFNYAQRVGRAGRRTGYPGFAITYCRRGAHDLYHFLDPARMMSGQVAAPVLSLQNQKIVLRHMLAACLSHFFRMYPQRFEAVEAFLGEMLKPRASADFRAFLDEQEATLEEILKAIVPRTLRFALGLADRGWIEMIAGEKSRLSLAEAEVASDYRTVKEYQATCVASEDFGNAGWAKRRGNEIAGENVLSFLSRKAVIPKYGFPVDVVELDTQRAHHGQDAFQVSLQRDLSIAVAEFAPSSKLIANKKMWTSYGLKKVAEKEWDRKLYKRCAKHSVFSQWRHGEPEPPTHCEDRLVTLKYVVPQFGFVTERSKPVEPTVRPARVFTTRPYFAKSLGDELGSVSFPEQAPLITIKKASPGLMVVLCEGRRGEGFYLCASCGAGFRNRAKSHRTPFGQECTGTMDQVSLGHEFVTDVLQLQCHPDLAETTPVVEPIWAAYALAYALVEGAAEILEVPSTDLSATTSYGDSPQGMPPIIMYDNVPGGAGLVARLENRQTLVAVLRAAHRRVGGQCNCDESTSCYGCLRSYRNQFVHQHLQRGVAARYLEGLASGLL